MLRLLRHTVQSGFISGPSAENIRVSSSATSPREEAKSYSGPPPESDCQVRISATVTQDRAGTLTARTLWAQPVCDNYVSYEPLAIVERGGATCWLTVREYEDGYDYILTKPGWVSQETASLDCKVR
jgi:hypothetical protein